MNCSYYCDSKLNKKKICPSSCSNSCPPGLCKQYFYEDGVSPFVDEHPNPNPNPDHVISTNLLIMTCVLGGVFFVAICCMAFLNFYSKWRKSRRRNSPPIIDDTDEDFIDGDHGPVIDHPIWYINTIGLGQSIIDSITICKYKKDEGLIDGTECSVCLSEFQQDDDLRLLPKCSHAFHLPCIDTWLRSHKNCPLCRAPIIRPDAIGGLDSAIETNSDDLDSMENAQMENLENQIGDNEVRARSNDFDALPIDTQRVSEILKKGLPYFDARNGEFRVQSDLTDNLRVVEEGSQPARRSVSLNSSSASVIYRAMADQIKNEGSSNSHSLQVKNQNLGIFTKQGSGNSSIYKLMKSSSIGRSLQKRPILMKRSVSSSGKLPVSRHSRSKTSILPL